MKQVRISRYQRGLVFGKGNYQRMLGEGVHWVWGNRQVIICDMTNALVVPVDLNILLEDPLLAEALEVLLVRDNEICIHFENDLLKGVLTPGRYAFWKDPVIHRFVKADISKVTIDEPLDRMVLQHSLLQPYVRSVEVAPNEKALLFIDGGYKGTLEPGTYIWWKNNIAVQVTRLEKRQQQIEVNGQEILTRDKAALRINAWARYTVTDVEQAVLQNKDWEKQLYVLLQLALREKVGGVGFDDLLEQKDAIASQLLADVRAKTSVLGVEVQDFGIRDIILPGDVKEIMNSVLVAEKKAQANSIMRREETASTRSLLNTARLMEENSMLWKLKEMEYVEKIAEKINHISLNGGSNLLGQMAAVFAPAKEGG